MTRIYRIALLASVSMSAAAIAACNATNTTPDAGVVGGACGTTSDCPTGQFCFKSSSDPVVFPGGYCTRKCDDARACKSSADCSPFGGYCNQKTLTCRDCGNDACLEGYCMKRCSSDADCGRSGYKCSQDFGVCAAAFDKLGSSCASDSACGGGMTCVKSISYPDPPNGPDGKPLTVQAYSNPFSAGYCTYKCDVSWQCPVAAGAICANPAGGAGRYCLRGCSIDEQCTLIGQTACRTVTVYPDVAGHFRDLAYCGGGDNMGSPCALDSDCTNNPSDPALQLKCVEPAKTGFKENICTRKCQNDLDCPFNSLCTGKKFCARKCYKDVHCGREKTTCKYKGWRQDPYPYDDLLYCSDASNLGGACRSDGDCTAGLKCAGGAAFPGGYCTADCAKDADCAAAGGSVCADGKCMRGCDDGDGRGRDLICGRKGYTCHKPSTDKGYVCTGYPSIGASCETDSDCSEGLVCRRGNAFPAGYCSRECSADSDCTAGGYAYCQNGYCARACSNDSDCGRFETICIDDLGGRRYCSRPPDFGAACGTDSVGPQNGDCTQGLDCRTGGNFPGGYCSRDCSTDADCPARGGGLCADGLCQLECSRDAECGRAGYTCRAETEGGTGDMVCMGIPNVGADCTYQSDVSKDDGCTKNAVYTLSCKSETGGLPACTMDCSVSSDCPARSLCSGGRCTRACGMDAECGRPLHFCSHPAGSEMVCSANPNIGAACVSDGDCYAGSAGGGLKCRLIAAGVKGCTKDCASPGQKTECFGESGGICAAGTPAGHCSRGCSSDADCGRPLVMYCKSGACEPAPNYDQSCSANADCNTEAGLSCAEVVKNVKVCTKKCASDADCAPAGYAKCETSGKFCWKACSRDEDCGGALKCDINKRHCTTR